MVGQVREIGLRATTVTTFDGADVVVPTHAAGRQAGQLDAHRHAPAFQRQLSTVYGADPRRTIDCWRASRARSTGCRSRPPAAIMTGLTAAHSISACAPGARPRDWVLFANDWRCGFATGWPRRHRGAAAAARLRLRGASAMRGGRRPDMPASAAPGAGRTLAGRLAPASGRASANRRATPGRSRGKVQ